MSIFSAFIIRPLPSATFFPLTVQRLTDAILNSYAEIAVAHIADSIGARSGESEKQLQRLQSELKAFQKVQNHLMELQSSVAHAQGEIGDLSDRYSKTEPDDLIQPFAPPQPELAAEASPVEAPADEVPSETWDQPR